MTQDPGDIAALLRRLAGRRASRPYRHPVRARLARALAAPGHRRPVPLRGAARPAALPFARPASRAADRHRPGRRRPADARTGRHRRTGRQRDADRRLELRLRPQPPSARRADRPPGVSGRRRPGPVAGACHPGGPAGAPAARRPAASRPGAARPAGLARRAGGGAGGLLRHRGRGRPGPPGLCRRTEPAARPGSARHRAAGLDHAARPTPVSRRCS